VAGTLSLAQIDISLTGSIEWGWGAEMYRGVWRVGAQCRSFRRKAVWPSSTFSALGDSINNYSLPPSHVFIFLPRVPSASIWPLFHPDSLPSSPSSSCTTPPALLLCHFAPSSPYPALPHCFQRSIAGSGSSFVLRTYGNTTHSNSNVRKSCSV